MFLFYVLVLRSRTCFRKIIWMSGLQLLGLFVFFCFFFLFYLSCRGLFFEKMQLRSNRARPTSAFFGLVFFSLFCPCRSCLFTRFGRASFFFLTSCRGAILSPVRSFAFLDSLGTLGGLRSLAPSEAFSRTRGGMGVCGRFFQSFFVFPLPWCLRLHTFH